MARQDRADAMWLAENWASLSDGTTTLTHPTRIRQTHREAAPAPSADLDLSAPADSSLARIE